MPLAPSAFWRRGCRRCPMWRGAARMSRGAARA